MKCSAVGAEVGWITNTSWPRTFSSISTCTSPSENLPTRALPIGTPSCEHTACASLRLALPLKTRRFSLLIGSLLVAALNVVAANGWGGRIRTYGCRDQNPVPWATWRRPTVLFGSGYRLRLPAHPAGAILLPRRPRD